MKTPDLRAEKDSAKAANRHQIVSPIPEATRAAWARAVTTQRVADLFKTAGGLPGHWTQLQQEVNRGNNNFVVGGQTDLKGRELIKFISDAVEKAAQAATFDFPEQKLQFTNDMGWLKICRERGQVKVRSRA